MITSVSATDLSGEACQILEGLGGVNVITTDKLLDLSFLSPNASGKEFKPGTLVNIEYRGENLMSMFDTNYTNTLNRQTLKNTNIYGIPDSVLYFDFMALDKTMMGYYLLKVYEILRESNMLFEETMKVAFTVADVIPNAEIDIKAIRALTLKKDLQGSYENISIVTKSGFKVDVNTLLESNFNVMIPAQHSVVLQACIVVITAYIVASGKLGKPIPFDTVIFNNIHLANNPKFVDYLSTFTNIVQPAAGGRLPQLIITQASSKKLLLL